VTIESNKTMGGIGAILLFIGLIPFGEPFTGIIALVGLILVLVALYGFAKIYKEKGIFNNFIYAIITGIVGSAVAGVVAVISLLTTLKNFLYQIYPGWDGNWSNLSGLTSNTSNIDMNSVLPLLVDLIVVFVVLWISVIVAAFLIRKSLKALSTKTSVGLFSIAALLLLIGAFLTIILIGFILMWIAVLLIAIAFFEIKPPLEPM